MQTHVDAAAAESDTFTFQTEPLLHSRMAAELDLAARADDAMPRNGAMRIAQRPSDLPRVPGESGGAGYLSIGRDLASWNLPNRRHEIAENERATGHTTGAAS